MILAATYFQSCFLFETAWFFGILWVVYLVRRLVMNFTRFARLTQRKSKYFIAQNVSSIQVIVFYYILMTIISFRFILPSLFREPRSHASFIDMFLWQSARSVSPD